MGRLVGMVGKDGLTQTAIARAIGVGQSSVALWVHGRSRPETHHRFLLEQLYGIPADEWLTDDERKAVKSALDRAASAA